MEPQTLRLKILHVLTLNGPNGEYGGPVRVARELCSELNRRGHQTHIISGARKGFEPIPAKGLKESFEFVEPLSRRLPISSLWSWKLAKSISREIRSADLVHIHFARDLIPYLTAFISILNRKPFVTQTHGMIITDGRLSTKLADILLTRPLLKKSRTNLVLTKHELNKMKHLCEKVHSEILPNGISVYDLDRATNKSGNRIIFCARLDKRKGVDKFIALAKTFEATNLEFEILGPDGGQLDSVLKAVKLMGPSGNLRYRGAIKSEQVQDFLKEADLLILPSKDEPFPMVILEALAVGTPVLVMPSCGFAEILRDLNHNFVCLSEDLSDLTAAFHALYRHNFLENTQLELMNFCKNHFGINRVVNLLEVNYSRAITYD